MDVDGDADTTGVGNSDGTDTTNGGDGDGTDTTSEGDGGGGVFGKLTCIAIGIVAVAANVVAIASRGRKSFPSFCTLSSFLIGSGALFIFALKVRR